MTTPREDETGEGSLAAARDEVERASQHYYHTPLQLGIDNRTKQFVVERCEPYIRGPRVLELGYVDGLWTDAILGRGGCKVDIVEGAERHAEHARARYSGRDDVRIFHQLFQEFEPTGTYDTIIAGDMLRYLPDPAAFLAHARQWLEDDGRLIATIPNSRSLHRRIGALMNMEPTPTRANRRDVEVGNLRSYDRYEFRHLLLEGGFEVKMLRGCFLKPLSSAQMQDWDDQLLRAFLDLGDELEDYCWFIYAVCHKRRPESAT
ncbi:MAG TPA: methyltransferase domain-containing protein [Pyrinomonadaceae bacterium]|jgi:SAM-dependent methyltransferase|nr:methyltransferase domain-containing protein [Pyrinomonadaceae bacterium]